MLGVIWLQVLNVYLIIALTVLCIKEKVRVPDGILMCYPALNLNYNSFTPSLFVSLDDPSNIIIKFYFNKVLPHTFLKICLSSYLQKKELQPAIDPLISPSLISDEIAK